MAFSCPVSWRAFLMNLINKQMSRKIYNYLVHDHIHCSIEHSYAAYSRVLYRALCSRSFSVILRCSVVSYSGWSTARRVRWRRKDSQRPVDLSSLSEASPCSGLPFKSRGTTSFSWLHKVCSHYDVIPSCGDTENIWSVLINSLPNSHCSARHVMEGRHWSGSNIGVRKLPCLSGDSLI